MNQALYAHMNNKRKMKKKKEAFIVFSRVVALACIPTSSVFYLYVSGLIYAVSYNLSVILKFIFLLEIF
jgi:hypothetical protein